MAYEIKTDGELVARGYSVPVYRAVRRVGGTKAAAQRYRRSIPTIRAWLTEPFRIPEEAIGDLADQAGVDPEAIRRDAVLAKARHIELRAERLRDRAAEMREQAAA